VDGTNYRMPCVPRGAWLEERYIHCGKRCICRTGRPHGAYWRLCWREGGRRRQRYVAKQHVDAYRVAVQRRWQERAERAASLEAAAVALRHARQLLRSLS